RSSWDRPTVLVHQPAAARGDGVLPQPRLHTGVDPPGTPSWVRAAVGRAQLRAGHRLELNTQSRVRLAYLATRRLFPARSKKTVSRSSPAVSTSRITPGPSVGCT